MNQHTSWTTVLHIKLNNFLLMFWAVVGTFYSHFFHFSVNPWVLHTFSCQTEKFQGNDLATTISSFQDVRRGSDKETVVQSENLFQRTEVLAGAFRLDFSSWSVTLTKKEGYTFSLFMFLQSLHITNTACFKVKHELTLPASNIQCKMKSCNDNLNIDKVL